MLWTASIISSSSLSPFTICVKLSINNIFTNDHSPSITSITSLSPFTICVLSSITNMYTHQSSSSWWRSIIHAKYFISFGQLRCFPQSPPFSSNIKSNTDPHLSSFPFNDSSHASALRALARYNDRSQRILETFNTQHFRSTSNIEPTNINMNSNTTSLPNPTRPQLHQSPSMSNIATFQHANINPNLELLNGTITSQRPQPFDNSNTTKNEIPINILLLPQTAAIQSMAIVNTILFYFIDKYIHCTTLLISYYVLVLPSKEHIRLILTMFRPWLVLLLLISI